MPKAERGMKMDMKLLRLLDLADKLYVRLSLSSIIKVMDAGHLLGDFERKDMSRLEKVRANIRNTIFDLLERSTVNVDEEFWGKDSLYSLVLTKGGLSEHAVRNILHPSGIRYD